MLDNCFFPPALQFMLFCILFQSWLKLRFSTCPCSQLLTSIFIYEQFKINRCQQQRSQALTQLGLTSSNTVQMIPNLKVHDSQLFFSYHPMCCYYNIVNTTIDKGSQSCYTCQIQQLDFDHCLTDFHSVFTWVKRP